MKGQKHALALAAALVLLAGPALAQSQLPTVTGFSGVAREAGPVAAVTPGGSVVDPSSTRAYAWSAGQKLAVGAISTQSAAIAATEVTLHATTELFVVVGANPTAANGAGALPMMAGEKFSLRLPAGQKVAAIRASTDGFLFILPVAP